MAKPAALAALAANNQGKFWEYHDRLFAEKEITEQSLGIIAKDLGLDLGMFNADRKSQALITHMNNDLAEANSLVQSMEILFDVFGDFSCTFRSQLMAFRFRLNRQVFCAKTEATCPPKRNVAHDLLR